MSHPQEDRKRLGRYYTPFSLSQALCDWAIQSPSDNVLEPSFGGCGFLEAARRRLTSLGNHKPNTKLFGCDIDQNAFHHLSEKIGLISLTKRFLQDNFISIDPSDFRIKSFDVIIGNPPYISHHDMSTDEKKLALERAAEDGYHLSSKASLWAYFILHSFKFLKQGGRIAWILPSSFLYAQYSSLVHEELIRGFKKVLVVPLEGRHFLLEQTKEKSVVLIAEGWGQGPARSNIVTNYVSSDNLINTIDLWSKDMLEGVNLANYRDAFVSQEALDIFNNIKSNPHNTKLGSLARILIGIVTGDNNFFVINDTTAQQHGITDYALKPILSKLEQAKGLALRKKELSSSRNADDRCLLINTRKLRRGNSPLKRYLESYDEIMKKANQTFSKRKIWHQPDDGRIPDAFLSYMHHLGPKLIINSAKTTCTNSIHRVFFNAGTTLHQRKLCSISLQSTFSQFSAEIVGRNYGSGVLKLEPSEAKEIDILMPNEIDSDRINQSFKKIDHLLRKGLSSQVQEEADNLVLGHLDQESISLLRAELTQLRNKRLILCNGRTKENRSS